MIKFEKPLNLNGAELLFELTANGINVAGLPIVDADGQLWLDIDSSNQQKAKTIIEVHNGTIMAPQLSVVDKLNSVGLNLDDLKTALGL